MFNIRNWYIYIVCAIGLQALTWSTISLVRNLLVYSLNPEAVAFQIAVVIIGLPVFLVHWSWAQRLARRSDEERGGLLRRLYLYGVLAASLGALVPNVFDFLRRLLGVTVRPGLDYKTMHLPVGEALSFHLIAILILGVLWFYHQMVIKEDTAIVPETGNVAGLRRLYVLGFSAAGLAMTTHSVIHLIRWIMQQLSHSLVDDRWLVVVLWEEIARLAVGAVLWVIFWRWAQFLFYSPSEEEHSSALRKFYLYGVICVGAINATINLTGILADLLSRLMGVVSKDSGYGLRLPLPIILGMGGLWAYHALVLAQDTQLASETHRQAGVRRLYYYLIAAVGLAALLVGLGGTISLILSGITDAFGSDLKEELSLFISAILAGLVVWIIPWRKLSIAVLSAEAGNLDALRSQVRKIYLYFFFFVATLTLLASAVFIVFKILSMMLGGDRLTLNELGNALAFSLIASGVLVYHGSLLRADTRRMKVEQASLPQEAVVLLIDVGQGLFGQALAAELQREAPGIDLTSITLPLGSQAAGEIEQQAVFNLIACATLIVGPWQIAVADSAGGTVSAELASAVASSPARKLLVPCREDGWEWAGLEQWNPEATLRHTVRAARQVLAGEPVKLHRPLSLGAIIGIVLGVLVVLSIVVSLLISFITY